MEYSKKCVRNIILVIFVLIVSMLAFNRISLAEDGSGDIENESLVYQKFVSELNQASDPYEYIYLYDQKEHLYYEMSEKEWNSYMTVLKSLSIEHLAKMEDEFRTEGEVDEVITLYIRSKMHFTERNYKIDTSKADFTIISDYAKTLSYQIKGEKNVVTDFKSYQDYLKTIFPLNVEKCMELLSNIDSSKTEEVEKIVLSLKNYLKAISIPNKRLSDKEIQFLFNQENTPIEKILLKSKKTMLSKAATYSMQKNADRVFAYGIPGELTKISVTEYYRKGGWKIHDEWQEGYLVTGIEGVVTGEEIPIFCADPQKNFHKGYYTKQPCPFSPEVVKIIAAALYRQKQIPEYSWLTKDYQYIAQQCIIWNVENELRKWIKPDLSDSHIRLEFGNGVHFPKPHQNIYIAEKVFKLVEECIIWGKQNYECFVDARADYYVKDNADQPIVRFYGTYTPHGFASLKKSSANNEITNGNNCYSLKGAEYGIYSDENCTIKKGLLVTDEKGNSNKIKLKVGNYWVKETKAPKGYALDQHVYKINVVEGQTREVKVVDIPSMKPVEILIEKIDKETNKNSPQGNASLENAHFEIKYYNGIWEKDKNPKELGKIPIRSWRFKTDKNGQIRYENTSKIEGDELYASADGKPMLPIGTLTIQEVKASEGYKINPTIYVVQIINDYNGNEILNIYNKTIIPEEVLKIKIVKIIKGTARPIQDVQFMLVRPNGSKEIVTTNIKGEALLKGLEYGQHVLMETFVPEGFVLNPGKITFTVADNSKIIVNNNTSVKTDGEITFMIMEDGNALMSVEDVYTDYTLRLHKQNQNGKQLLDAEFTIYDDLECRHIIKKERTNQDGQADFSDLKVEKNYYLKETKAPKGYEIPLNKNGSEIIYKVSTIVNPSTGTLEYYINDEKQTSNKITGTVNNPVLNFTILNKTDRRLPQTGTSSRLSMFLCSLGCIAFWFYHRKYFLK